MRPAFKVLKALLPHEAWHAEWYLDATGAFRTDIHLSDDMTGSPRVVTVCPLGWLEWRCNHALRGLIDAAPQETCLPCSPEDVEETYAAFNLDSAEAQYLLSLRSALARVLGLASVLQDACGVGNPFRLSAAEKADTRQQARHRRARRSKGPWWELTVVWPTVWPDLPPDRYKRFAHALEGAQTTIGLFALDDASTEMFLQYDGDMETRRN